MNRNKQVINIAMIGAGGYAFEVIKRLWKLSDRYEIIAISSLPGYRAMGLTECINKGIPIYYDLSEMLEAVKGRADMIFIPTSIHSHYELAKICIEQGFDVYVEKPPVAVIQDYDDIAASLEKHGRRGAIGFQYLYTAGTQNIKDMLFKRKYGRIKRVRSFGAWIRYDSYYDITQWGGKSKCQGKWVLDGSISNPLAHMLANSLYLATAKPLSMATPVSVQAELYSAHDIEGEDTSSLRIITDEGVEIISNATLCPNEDSEVETVIECEYADIIFTDFCRCRVVRDGEVIEKFEDNSEHRTYMLESIADSYVGGSDFRGDIKNCRAFTLSVNCAYESSRGVERIDEIYIDKQKYNDTIKRVISDIDEAIREAHNSGSLLSQTGLDWTVSKEPFDCAGYDRFPVWREMEESLCKKMTTIRI